MKFIIILNYKPLLHCWWCSNACENKLKWIYSYNDIYTTMKNHNKLSFKKVQSGTNSIDIDKLRFNEIICIQIYTKLK